MNRKKLLQQLLQVICSIQQDHPIRIGIDGVDASGKTWLADELAKTLNNQVIRASIDGFHNPKEIRYKLGRESAEGYYSDSFNKKAVLENLLEPLGENGNLMYRTKVFNYKTDSKVDAPVLEASPDSILIMDGVFLYCPKLVDHWDLKVFLDVPFKVTVDRAVKRDMAADSSWDKNELTKLYKKRYVEGQKLYFKEADPKGIADIIIDNTDFGNPKITGVS